MTGKRLLAATTIAVTALGSLDRSAAYTTGPPKNQGRGFVTRPRRGAPWPTKHFRSAARQQNHNFLLSAHAPLRATKERKERKRVAISRDRGWHRRAFSVFSRQKKAVRLNVAKAADDKLVASPTRNATELFILETFDRNTPETIFPANTVQIGNDDENQWPLSPADLGIAEVVLKQLATEPNTTETDDDTDQLDIGSVGGSLGVRLTRAWFQRIAYERIDRWSRGDHKNLKVQCDPKGTLPGLLFRGRFQCDASCAFDGIAFRNIRMSGGRLEAKRMSLNLWSFTSDRLPNGGPRYPNQFDFLAHNVTFTQDDLFESSCIRNGLRRLLTRILKKQGVKTTTVDIRSISVLSSGKIAVKAQAATLFGSPVPFEVRSGIGSSSRGHIMTFPGLEISLSRNIGLFVPVLPEVTLDLGHNAQLLDLEIDGSRAQMQLSARITITPEHTIKLQNYAQSTSAYAAQFSVDVGRWLTRIGNFTS